VGGGVGAIGGAGGRARRQICGILWRSSSEIGDALEKKEEREGEVPWRDSDNLLRFGMRRTRHCEFVGEGATLEQSGENEELEGEIFKFKGKKISF